MIHPALVLVVIIVSENTRKRVHEWSVADPGFWSGGVSEFSPQGGPEPQICSKHDFFPQLLKTA